VRNLQGPSDDLTLFDLEACAWWNRCLSVNAVAALRRGWQGIFQRTILRLLREPAERLGSHFDERQGRPTKELYALSGLLIIAEFKNWTIDDAAAAWSFHADVQFALNLPRDGQYLCPRTIDSYRRLLREDVQVQEIFTTVTSALVEELELDIRKQRLDSTHVLSAMARLGRVQLLAVSVRRFLRALQRHDAQAYAALDDKLRERYEAAETRLFGFGTRNPESRDEALAQVAADLAALVDRFGQATLPAPVRASYGALERLLREHCEIREDRTVVVRAKSQAEHGGSSRCLQNPSDPEAGYNGHKGAGYQVQLAQALPPRDAEGKIEGPGLLTACMPQSASVRDSEGLGEVLSQQQKAGLLPEQTLADTIYGSDANVRECAELGVTLVSPVGGAPTKKGDQPARHNCTRSEGELKERLAARREEQQTEQWQSQYRLRSGIEGVHRAVDVVTGIKKLRVRGKAAVSVAVLLKATGWNIVAAAKIAANRARRARKAALAKAKMASGAANATYRHIFRSSQTQISRRCRAI
jgi:bifunctional DNA-binding transcriptional regulator/antitoxin component of YhaV-PrlF toxin-antitoxin module